MTILAPRPERSSSDNLASIFELTRSVANARRTEDIYEASLLCLRESLNVEKSSILIFDPDGVMRFKAWLNLSAPYRSAVEGHSPWNRDTKEAQPVLVPDVRNEASLAPLRQTIESEGIVGLAFIPLVADSRLLGKFMLYYAEPHEFSEHEVLVAQTIAAQVAFALDQQAHRNEREYLDAVFRSAITGVTQTDANGHFVMINDTFCQLTGYSREQLLQLDSYAISHPEDREPTHVCFGALAAGAPHYVLEKRYVRPDGSIVWVHNNFSAVRDASGNLMGAIAIVLDITERKASEQVLRDSEERYRSLISGLGLAVYTTDSRGRITLYNDAARELWGRSPQIGVDLWCGSSKIFEPDGVTEVPLEDCPMAVSIKEDRPVRGVEIVVERPDGSCANILPYPTPLHDSRGNLTGAVNVLVDITELRHAEAAVRQSEERFRTLTTTAPVGIIVTDRSGNCLFVNEHWLHLTGLTNAEEALGRGWVKTLHPEDRDRIIQEWSTYAAKGGSHSSEYRHLRPNGVVVWAKGAATELSGSDGELTGYIGTITDITALKHAEQLKDQFLSLVSHELRTPLATIYGSSRLLKERFERIPESDRAELLADVVSEAERLQRIIENLLLLTRLDATGFEPEPVALPVIVRQTLEKVKARAPHRNFRVAVEDDVPIILANPTYVELVLENLLGNALKYSPADTLVDVQVRKQDGGTAVVIGDRGIGIDDEQAERLFEAFYRSKQARSLASGVGIGLAVCKRVIEVQGGTIWGRPRDGGGSEFGFLLQGAPDTL
ncbi:MAG: PAS domain S-box protein [Dehalococcoidia bacterium]